MSKRASLVAVKWVKLKSITKNWKPLRPDFAQRKIILVVKNENCSKSYRYEILRQIIKYRLQRNHQSRIGTSIISRRVNLVLSFVYSVNWKWF